MWFKNLQVYRLPAPWAYTAEQLAAALAPQSFTPASSNELQRQGWASPRGTDQLVHVVNKQMLILLATEKKLLPSSVINQVAKARANELEEQQGFRPGKKAMKELKERVADELLPRAFSVPSNTWCWIDPVNGWLVVDAASGSKADDVLKLLLKVIDKFPVESLRVARSPVACMTAWLDTDEAPAGFTVDRDAELRSTGESRAAVRFVKHTLDVADVRRHIAAGKQCRRLAMTWSDRVSITLHEDLSVKGIKALDVLTESSAKTGGDDERFDNDFMLMTGELAKLLADLVEALGGEAHYLVSKAQEASGDRPAIVKTAEGLHNAVLKLQQLAVKGASEVVLEFPGRDMIDENDPMYDQAVAIVLAQRRVSISLVQRHLRIGYNRTARLIETMEKNGVVGPMQANGDRAILLSKAEADDLVSKAQKDAAA